MKLTTLISETPRKRIKLLISEQQLKNLSSLLSREKEDGTNKNNNSTKINTNAKKKK